MAWYDVRKPTGEGLDDAATLVMALFLLAMVALHVVRLVRVWRAPDPTI